MAALFEIRPSPGKGNGVYATKDISQGTAILRDKLVMVIDQIEPYVTEQAVRNAFDKLSRADQRRFLQLHATDESLGNGGRSRLYRIYKDNAFGDEEKSWMALTVSRINHSCAPIAIVTDASIGSTDLEIMAETPISKGEEIYICYKEGELQTLTSKQRTTLLRASYGFVCSCPACGLDSASLRLGNMRRDLACCLWYRLRGCEKPDLDALGDKILSRTPEEGARFQELVKDLDQPLALSEQTVYNLVLVKLYEADGVQSGLIAEAYACIAMSLWEQVDAMDDIVVLQSARYVREWMEHALSIVAKTRKPGSSDILALRQQWLCIRRDPRMDIAIGFMDLEKKRNLSADPLYDTAPPFAILFKRHGDGEVSPQLLTEFECRRLLRQRAAR